MPKISVLLPVYNGEKYIQETMESVLGQSCGDFECVVIDDGSTDNTLKLLQGFVDPRIRIIHANHEGIVKALNLGLKKSQGEYVVRIDADDICAKERFEKLLNYMEANPSAAVCGSWAKKINQNGEVVGTLHYPPVEDKAIKKYSLLHNPFIHPSIIFRKDVVVKVGMYKAFTHTEDYELWTRVLREGEGHNIPEELISYRVHENQITRKGNLKMRLAGVWVRVLAVTRLLF